MKIARIVIYIIWAMSQAAASTLVAQSFLAGGYQGSQFGNASMVPASVTIQNLTIVAAQSLCYNATQTVTVAGGGTTFTVESGGYATMIAGKKVDYLPTTRVYQGGTMHGYITYYGQYCVPTKDYSIAAVEDIGTDEPITPDPSGQRQLEAYPNPTPGDFTLEMEGVWSIGMKKAIVYNLLGRKVLARDVGGPGKYTLSLAGVPTGIYVIHVTGDGESGSVRIVKK